MNSYRYIGQNFGKYLKKLIKYRYIGEISPIIVKKISEIFVNRLSKGYIVAIFDISNLDRKW